MESCLHSNILNLIERQAERYGDSIAFEDTGDLKLSYGDLVATVRRLSRLLTGHGVKRGSRVAIVLPNGPEMAITLLGVCVTAVAVPLNPTCRSEEFHAYFEAIRVGFLIVLAGSDSVARTVAAGMSIKVLELSGDCGLTLSGAPDCDVSAMDRGGETTLPEPDDVAAILMTSGSTGQSKKVPLTHRNLCVSVSDTCRSMALGPEDRCLCMWEQFHISGLTTLLMAPLAAGGTVICTSGFDPAEFYRLVETKKPTWFQGVPAALHELVSHAEKNPVTTQLTSLRLIRSGAAALPWQLMVEIETVFGVPVIQAFGMTEAAPQITATLLPPTVRKLGSVGQSIGPEIRILGPDGAALEPGEVGEVALRGDNMVSGYEDDPEATARTFRDGWFFTGDTGYLDEDNYLFLKGRLKQMINRGGEQVSPHEVDDVLMTHPAVAQAATFAVEHRTLGEDVAAAVVLRPMMAATEDALRVFVAERLTTFKVPRRVVFLDRMPLGATGKVDRLALAEVAKAEGPASTLIGPASDLESQLQEIWAAALGLERVGLHDNYFDLGGDSLQAVELFLHVEEAVGRRLPASVLIEADTVAKMAWYIENDPAPSCLVPLQPKGDLAPFFCVAGLGDNGLSLRGLARHMGESRPFYGICAVELDGGDGQPPDLDAMAAGYVGEIRKLQPAGPYHLGGHSLGGQVAYVMAQQLQAANEEVALLALIDVYGGVLGDFHHEPAAQWLGRHNRAMAGVPLKDRPAYVLRRARNIAAHARTSLRRRMLLAARPKPDCGDAVLFKAERQLGRHSDGRDGWHRLIEGRLQVISITGSHTGLLKEPHVRKLAGKLAVYLKE